MLRRLNLMVAALAMLVAPLAMQSGVAMMPMPVDHREMARVGHCGDEDSGDADKSGAMTQCCVAMCSAVAPPGAPSPEPISFHAPLLGGFRSTEHRPFLAKLPTPPPRAA
jgi:hypothetical protein